MKRAKRVMPPHITRFVEPCLSLAKEPIVGQPAPPFQHGNGGFADWLIITVQCLRERETETFRSVVDKFKVMGPVRDVLGLEHENLPDPSTLCKAMDRLTMALRQRLLQRTSMLFDLGEVAAIDATSFNRIAANRRYAEQTNYRFLAMKTTFLTDCDSGAILDVHYTTSRPHDTKIGWQMLRRNLDRMAILTADKGYDWADLREMLRSNDVRPVIKHREFRSLDKAHNARLDDDLSHRRSGIEAEIQVLKQRYGDDLSARSWYDQFRELAIKAAVKNIDSGIGASHY